MSSEYDRLRCVCQNGRTDMSDQTRSYQMRRRAEAQEQTRLRITESAVALHGSVGPSRTSISAVAAHAGVRRSTVYRHFPDEAALFDACSAHWRTEAMLDNLFRDETTTQFVRERFARFRGYLDAARDTLVAGRRLRGARQRRTQAAIGHAI